MFVLEKRKRKVLVIGSVFETLVLSNQIYEIGDHNIINDIIKLLRRLHN